MDCPAKSNTVNNALCELFYPYGCGTRCKNLYKRWMKTEKEVQEIENKAGCQKEKGNVFEGQEDFD
jgi:endogenous inhibitor of DNA gyrase (YacG/DUF329 family)